MTATQTDPSPALVCRFCGGTSTEPGSTCPHCGREVMAVCPNCKRYVDNRLTACDRCGSELAAVGAIAQAGRVLVAPAGVAEFGPPPRRLTGAQWQAVLGPPFLLAGIALLTLALVEVGAMQAARTGIPDPTGLTRLPLIVAGLYAVLAVLLGVSIALQRYDLLHSGVAVRGRITRVVRRRLSLRGLGQFVRFTFADARGETREGTLRPAGGLGGLSEGDSITVLYMPEDPARCALYPFLF